MERVPRASRGPLSTWRNDADRTRDDEPGSSAFSHFIETQSERREIRTNTMLRTRILMLTTASTLAALLFASPAYAQPPGGGFGGPGFGGPGFGGPGFGGLASVALVAPAALADLLEARASRASLHWPRIARSGMRSRSPTSSWARSRGFAPASTGSPASSAMSSGPRCRRWPEPEERTDSPPTPLLRPRRGETAAAGDGGEYHRDAAADRCGAQENPQTHPVHTAAADRSPATGAAGRGPARRRQGAEPQLRSDRSGSDGHQPDDRSGTGADHAEPARVL